MRSRLLTTLRRDDDAGLVYLLRDEFITAEAAPIASPRTCEPGPGTATIIDAETNISVTNSRLLMGALTTPTTTEQRYQGESHARTAGYAFVVTATPAAGGNDFFIGLGYADSNLGYGTFDGRGVWRRGSDGFMRAMNGAGSGIVVGSVAAAEHSIALIERAAGEFIAVDTGAGYRLYWVGKTSSYATLYPTIVGNVGQVEYDDATVLDLSDAANANPSGTDWSTEHGLATSRVASPVDGETTTMTADAIVEVTWTPSAGETLDLMARRTDDTATWSIVCAESTAGNPDTIKIIERNAGDTERASASQTFAAASTYRIMVRLSGTEIRAFVDTTAKSTYSSASFNASATGVKLAGSSGGADLIAWPVDLSSHLPAGI